MAKSTAQAQDLGEYIAPDDFDAMQLLALEVGDVIEVPGLFPGLDEEDVIGMVTVKEPDSVVLRFSYFGVWIGSYQFNAKEGTWSKV